MLAMGRAESAEIAPIRRADSRGVQPLHERHYRLSTTNSPSSRVCGVPRFLVDAVRIPVLPAEQPIRLEHAGDWAAFIRALPGLCP